MTRVIDLLIEAIRSAAVYNPDVQAAPACILWPDRERQWEPAIPRLQVAMPELFVLGDYAPERRTGPAIWLRCVLGGIFCSAQLTAQGRPHRRPVGQHP